MPEAIRSAGLPCNIYPLAQQVVSYQELAHVAEVRFTGRWGEVDKRLWENSPVFEYQGVGIDEHISKCQELGRGNGTFDLASK
jgi:hypothetical protein